MASNTETVLINVVAAVKTLVESITALHVYNHEPAVIPEYPAACVTVSDFSVTIAANRVEDVAIDFLIWIFYRNLGDAEIDCRNQAAAIVDLIQADHKLGGTVRDSGLNEGGFQVKCGKAVKGNEVLMAATVEFTTKTNQTF